MAARLEVDFPCQEYEDGDRDEDGDYTPFPVGYSIYYILQYIQLFICMCVGVWVCGCVGVGVGVCGGGGGRTRQGRGVEKASQARWYPYSRRVYVYFHNEKERQVIKPSLKGQSNLS